MLQGRTKGIVIALFGIICVTPDAVLVRFLSSGGAQPWTIVFWKMIFSLPITIPYAWYEMMMSTQSSEPTKGEATTLQPSNRRYAWLLLAATVLPQAAVNVGFTFSLVHTSAAHALLLINLNPLWCALAGRFALGDPLPWRTIVALMLAMGCMLVTFLPEIVNTESQDESATTTKGVIISLLTGFTIAIYISFIRKGGIEGINMLPVAPVAAVLPATLALILQKGQVTAVANEWDLAQWKYWLAMVAEGTIVGVAFVALAIAPRFITGAELALVILLEVLIAPLWVFCAYGETPSLWTFVGGVSLVLVLAIHEAISMFVKTDADSFNVDSEGIADETSDIAAETRT